MVVSRGLRQAASYHQDRLRQEKLGYFYDVITNGFGAMQDQQPRRIPGRYRFLRDAFGSAPLPKEYLDRLAVLRDQVFVLDHMYMSLFSTVHQFWKLESR